MPVGVNNTQSSSYPSHHQTATDGKRDGGPMRSDFVCRFKYSNTLPDIPFEAKFLACPFVSLNRFIEYKPSSLEKNFKFELLAEPDLGINIDLINPETYYVDPDGNKKQHHPVDAELLEDETTNPQNSRRSLQHSKIVPWMRKTEYISSEFTRFGVTADRQETKVGYSIKKRFQAENFLYRDRTSQISAIRKTFDDVKPTKKHPSKKGVHVVEEVPFLPDFENWRHPFALVVFDGDPISSKTNTNSGNLMSQALIRGMMDEQGEQFVTYFLPTEETMEKRMRDKEDEQTFDEDYVYKYNSVRDYNWLVRNKSTKGFEQDVFLVSIRKDGAYYNELETRVSLTRRKIKRKGARQATMLYVRNRPYDDAELHAQEDRMNQLLHPYDEKDEDEYKESSEEGDEGVDEQHEQCNEEGNENDEEKSGSDREDQGNEKDSHSERGSSESDENDADHDANEGHTRLDSDGENSQESERYSDGTSSSNTDDTE
ncbi:hypothetical protein AB6A40_005918 [Gnathostoma spinigerum]|uniref:RNA polymerase II-associated factor 1 homolog n=1 Tax=Gnathostoma spinigerum TaxID=75299 RepID=A0ABD6EM31_9BILA